MSQQKAGWTQRLKDGATSHGEAVLQHNPAQPAVNRAIDSIDNNLALLRHVSISLDQALNPSSDHSHTEPPTDPILRNPEFATADRLGQLAISNNLCNHCAKFVAELKTFCAGLGSIPATGSSVDLRGEAAHFYHPASSLASFQEAASLGCNICAYNLYILAKDTPLDDCASTAEGVWATSISHWQTKASSQKVYFALVDGENVTAAKVMWHVKSMTSRTFASTKWSNPSLLNTTSANNPGTYETIRHWLDRCVSSHPCDVLPEDKTNFRPTRLINTGIDGRVRLESGANVSCPYATLSYCWGAGLALKLTHETLDSFKRDIPWHRIPTTLQDAISFCRGLDIHYIWIDSLCIIQDDDQDWKAEAARMAEVYRHSLVCIAANDSDDTMAGCLWQRGPAFQGLEIQGNKILYPDCSYDFLRHSGLSTRGWCLQEMAMSRRMIHLSKKGAWMECLADIVSEGFPVDLPEATRIKQISPLKRVMVSPRGFASGNHRYEDGRMQLLCRASAMKHTSDRRKGLGLLLAIWGEFAVDYASRHLTRWSDKLIAFDAVLSSLVDSKLLGVQRFGHWGDLLPWDLLWSCRKSNSSRRHQLHEIRLPSWSWLSVSGVISYNALSVSPWLATRPPSAQEFIASCPGFTEDTSGSLCLRTRVRQICVVRHLSRGTPLRDVDEGFTTKSNLTQADALFVNQMLGTFVFEDPDFKTNQEIDQDAKLHCALIWHSDIGGIDQKARDRASICCGLLIRRRKDGRFRRVATFSIEGTSESLGRAREFLNQWEACQVQEIELC